MCSHASHVCIPMLCRIYFKASPLPPAPLSAGNCQLVSCWNCNYCHGLDRLIGCLLERMTFRSKSRFIAFPISKSRTIEITSRFSHWNALGIRVGLTFQYSEVSFWEPGGSFLGLWMTILVNQWSTGTPPGTPWWSRPGFYRFGLCFRTPLGVTLGTFWTQFCALGYPNGM